MKGLHRILLAFLVVAATLTGARAADVDEEALARGRAAFESGQF
jgi:hypothetical protein